MAAARGRVVKGTGGGRRSREGDECLAAPKDNSLEYLITIKQFRR